MPERRAGGASGGWESGSGTLWGRPGGTRAWTCKWACGADSRETSRRAGGGGTYLREG